MTKTPQKTAETNELANNYTSTTRAVWIFERQVNVIVA